MSDPKIVDIAAQKTEAEWQAAIDKFWLAATPEIFKWLGWVAALAVLKLIDEKSGSYAVSAIRGICFIAMIFYFNAFFFQFVFVNQPIVRNPKVRWFVSLAISGGLAALASLLAVKAMYVLSSTRP
jgi:hypothetical protein